MENGGVFSTPTTGAELKQLKEKVDFGGMAEFWIARKTPLRIYLDRGVTSEQYKTSARHAEDPVGGSTRRSSAVQMDA